VVGSFPWQPGSFDGLAKVLQHIAFISDAVVFIGESVDEVTAVTPYAKSEVAQSFLERGWIADVSKLSSVDYGAVVQRERALVLAIHFERAGCSAEIANTHIRSMFDLLNRLKINASNLQAFLLGSTDRYVASALQEAQDAKCNLAKAAVQDSWADEFEKVLQSYDLHWNGLDVEKTVAESPWFDTLSYKEKMTLKFEMWKNPKALGADIGQRAGRNRAVENGCLPPMLAGSKFFIWSPIGKCVTVPRFLTGFDVCDPRLPGKVPSLHVPSNSL